MPCRTANERPIISERRYTIKLLKLKTLSTKIASAIETKKWPSYKQTAHTSTCSFLATLMQFERLLVLLSLELELDYKVQKSWVLFILLDINDALYHIILFYLKWFIKVEQSLLPMGTTMR